MVVTRLSRVSSSITSRSQGCLAVLDEKLDRLFYYLEHFRERENLDRVADRRAPAISSPTRIESSSQAQARSDHMALTIHSKEDVKDVAEEYQPRAIAQGSKVLHRRFETGPHTGKSELDNFKLQVIESMRRARMIDKDCTLQFGSLAVLKYTDAGPTWWKLQEHWTPFISDISRASVTVLDLLLGSCTKWTIRGFNLQIATLKATTIDESETLIILHHYKMESGEDVLLCEEPHLVQSSAPLFQEKVYICASKFVEVEDGLTFNLQSELQSVPRAYCISVVKSVIPSVWTMIMILILSLMRGLSRDSRPITDGLLELNFSLKLSGLQRAGNNAHVWSYSEGSEGNSILSNVLSELYSLIRVYLFATLIPIFVSTLRPLSHAIFPFSGYAVPGHGTTTTLEDITASPCPALPPPVEDNLLDDTTDNVSPGAGPPPVEDKVLEDFISSPCSRTPPLDDNMLPEHITNSQEPTTPPPVEDNSIMKTYVHSLEEGGDTPSPQKVSTSEDFSNIRNPVSPLHDKDKLIKMDENNDEGNDEETQKDNDERCRHPLKYEGGETTRHNAATLVTRPKGSMSS